MRRLGEVAKAHDVRLFHAVREGLVVLGTPHCRADPREATVTGARGRGIHGHDVVLDTAAVWRRRPGEPKH